MNLLLSAGEAPRDLHGALLLGALRKQNPRLAAFGMGGAPLTAEGLDRVVSCEEMSVVGVLGLFEKLPGARARAAAAIVEAFASLARRLQRSTS